jgi:hypothetical protein
MKELINGQDVSFDTHQAGDSQEAHLKDLHLEKRLHKGGKARFPLFGDGKPSHSGKMNKDTLEIVTKEVKKALKKNERLTNDLAETIVNTLNRYRGRRTINEIDEFEKLASEAAKKIAGYFGLDDKFLRKVTDYGKYGGDGRLVSFMTVHLNPDKGTIHEIYQDKDSVEIRKARRNYPLNKLYR